MNMKVSFDPAAAAEEVVEKTAPAPATAAVPADSLADSILADALTRVAAPPVQEATTEEESGLTLGLPPTLEYLENVPNTFNGTAFEIRLYGEGCLECKHLVPSAEEPVDACHFNNGNRFCPAAFHRIVFVGHRMRLADRLKKAKAAGDTNRILKVFASLENESLSDKEFVMREAGLLV